MMTFQKILEQMPKDRAYAITDAVVFKLFEKCHNCQTTYVQNDFKIDGVADWVTRDLVSITCMKCKSSASVFIERDAEKKAA